MTGGSGMSPPAGTTRHIEQPDDVMDAETVKTEFFGECGCNERGHDADCPLLTPVGKSPHDHTSARRHCEHGYLWIGGLFSYCPWCGPKRES